MQGLPTILVVEDDHLIQSIVEEALKEGGFEIGIASSSEPSSCLTVPTANIERLLPTSIWDATRWMAGKLPATPERSIRHFRWSI